jgi:hypothetical protein
MGQQEGVVGHALSQRILGKLNKALELQEPPAGWECSGGGEEEGRDVLRGALVANR